MTTKQWVEFDETLAEMTPLEKAELIERAARSLRKENRQQGLLPPEEVARWIAEIAALPMESPDDGFSGRDHDTVLYGPRISNPSES